MLTTLLPACHVAFVSVARGVGRYDAFLRGTVLVNDESGPRLRTLLLNLFRELAVLNGIRSSTHHIVQSAAETLIARVHARTTTLVQHRPLWQPQSAHRQQAMGGIPHAVSSLPGTACDVLCM